MKKYIPTIVFIAILITIIFFDSFKAGFGGSFFLLDFVPTPIYKININFFQISIFTIIYNVLVYIFGYLLLTKMYIYSLVAFTIYIGYKLGDYFIKKNEIIDNFYQNIIYISCIAIIVINPFFTERMATQPGVRNGILFVGAGRYLLAKNFSNKIDTKTILYVGLLRGFSINIMNHGLFMLILLSIAYLIATKFKSFWQIIKISIIVGLLNINRIVGGFIGTNEIIKGATSFNAENIFAFATQPLGNLPVELSTALGYGFWAEQGQRLITAQVTNPYRYIFGILVLIIGFWGIYVEIKNKKGQNMKFIYISIVLLIILLWLGIGISNNIGNNLMWRIYENLPGYRGFREPHKWIGLYIMILIPFVINGFISISKKYDSTIVLSLFIFLLYGWAPGIINMSGLYELTDYPKDYNTSRSFILSKYPDSKFILLPRHSYMSCNWTSNVISITATDFYKPSIVKTADNIEIGSLYTNNNNIVSDQIDIYIRSGQDNKIIKSLGYSGFIMRKGCSNAGNFARTNNIKKFNNIYSGNDVSIYLIK